jgi:hypothetical protein
MAALASLQNFEEASGIINADSMDLISLRERGFAGEAAGVSAE